MADVLEIVAQQREAVDSVLQELYDSSDELFRNYVKGDAFVIEDVNRRFARLGAITRPARVGGKYSMNDGPLPFGGGVKAAAFFVGYFPFAMGFKLTEEEILTGTGSGNIGDIVKETFGKSMDNYKVIEDIIGHQSGDGILAGAAGGSTVSGGNTMTFSGASDRRRADMLVEGLGVEVYSSDLATRRVPADINKPIVVETVDHNSATVVLSQTLTGLANGDVIAFAGLKSPDSNFFFGFGGASPELSSFQSGYPTSAQLGVTGDAFRHGLPYMVEHDGSKYFYGVLRSALPQIRPVFHNAGTAAFQFDMVTLLLGLAQIKRGSSSMKGMIGCAHPAQFHAAHKAGQAFASMLVNGPKWGPSADLGPSNVAYDQTFDLVGTKTYKDKRVPRDEIWFIDPSHIGRAQNKKVGLHSMKDNRGGIYESRDSGGRVKSSVTLYISDSMDYVARDIGIFCRLFNLGVPTGY